jgi:hypothetical protein
MDTEWLALRAGVKPAFQRGVSGPEDAEAVAARFLAADFAVARARLATGREIIYVAACQADADALRDAEAALLLSQAISFEREAVALEEVGRRLGYPPCCVARRVARNRDKRLAAARRGWRWSWPWRLLRGKMEPADEDYLGAVDGWVERPAWELNRFALPGDMFLITFEPCTYSCPAAVNLARRTLDVVSRESDVDGLTAVLRRPILIGRGHEERAFASLDRSGARIVIEATAPVVPAAGAFAANLRGRRVGRRGTVGKALLLDFGG